MSMHLNTLPLEARRGVGFPRAGVQSVVSCRMWMLGTEARPSARAAEQLASEPSLQPHIQSLYSILFLEEENLSPHTAF